jgi:hypothetical protein
MILVNVGHEWVTVQNYSEGQQRVGSTDGIVNLRGRQFFNRAFPILTLSGRPKELQDQASFFDVIRRQLHHIVCCQPGIQLGGLVCRETSGSLNSLSDCFLPLLMKRLQSLPQLFTAWFPQILANPNGPDFVPRFGFGMVLGHRPTDVHIAAKLRIISHFQPLHELHICSVEFLKGPHIDTPPGGS